MEAASSSTLIRGDSQNKSLSQETKQRDEVIIYGVEAFVSHVGGAVVKLRPPARDLISIENT
jgi:hypothetical protein